MALSHEDKKDVAQAFGKKAAGAVARATSDAKNKAIHAKMKGPKYPGYRKMTSSQRYNARLDRIWEEAKKNGAI